MAHGSQADPFASNNTLYPQQKELPQGFKGFRVSNYRYPYKEPQIARPWDQRINGKLTTTNAPAYVNAVKSYLKDKHIDKLINEPLKWTPGGAGWYDMPWGGQGSLLPNGEVDPNSGREALIGSYTGQVLLPKMYPSQPPSSQGPFQNHSTTYYNDVAAHQLGKIWKDPFRPDTSEIAFPEGSVVVKVEGVTLKEEEWPAVKGSPVSYVYRPPVGQQSLSPVVTPLRFLQLAVRVKDQKASPETGWVFIAFAYNADQAGEDAWEKTIPVGAMWGNDPQLVKSPDFGSGQLKETWVNDYWQKKNRGKNFVMDSLGWGGRLAAPLDLALRNRVIFVDGGRETPTTVKASSCISCHSTGQYPFTANLYPSPNMYFPPEKGKFLLYRPGSKDWNLWFRNLDGKTAFSSIGHRSGILSTDYDMMLTFALMRATSSPEVDTFIRNPVAGH